MSANAFDIQRGMEVFASDGQKIGTVDALVGGAGTAIESGIGATGTVDEDASNADDRDKSDFGLAGDLSLSRAWSGNEVGTGHDVTRDPTELREEYGSAAMATQSASDSGYFTVKEGGILGLGAKDLFIPFNAVETVAADGVVTLSYTKDEVGERFNNKPDGMQDSDAPDMPIV